MNSVLKSKLSRWFNMEDMRIVQSDDVFPRYFNANLPPIVLIRIQCNFTIAVSNLHYLRGFHLGECTVFLYQVCPSFIHINIKHVLIFVKYMVIIHLNSQ